MDERIARKRLHFNKRVNPVREFCSLTVCADGGIKPPSALSGNDHRLKSVAFSNGVNSENKPFIGITMGDPRGIGPEVTLKALKNPRINRLARFLIIGDFYTFSRLDKKIKSGIEIKRIKALDEINTYGIHLYHIGRNTSAGHVQIQCIDKAVEIILQKKIDALVTAPVNKASISDCGFEFSGHTEYIAGLSEVKNPVMMFASKFFKLALVTTHVPIKSLVKSITASKIYQTIKLVHSYSKKYFGMIAPKIAVCGLNPHAGENGTLGKEEKEVIEPAIERVKRDFRSIKLFGPFPADTLFHDAYKGKYDVIVAMFHDQGLGPLKMLDFKRCVNVTLGLPFIRTSPSHGTAIEIAGKGIADSSSMEEAIKLAVNIYKKVASGK